MEKFNCWILKNKWGSFLLWTLGIRKKHVIDRIGKDRWVAWKERGHKIVKIKFMEVT